MIIIIINIINIIIIIIIIIVIIGGLVAAWSARERDSWQLPLRGTRCYAAASAAATSNDRGVFGGRVKTREVTTKVVIITTIMIIATYYYYYDLLLLLLKHN